MIRAALSSHTRSYCWGGVLSRILLLRAEVLEVQIICRAASMMSTAKEICDGVPRSLLDSLVSDIHLSDIASHITEWRELAPYLDLSEVEEKDIVDSYPNLPKLQRREALRKWKESNGNKATYRRLICILCSQDRAKTAQSLKQLLIQTTESTSIEQDLDVARNAP